MSEKNFASGIYFNPPHRKAPEYVLGSISVRPEDFVVWIGKQAADEKGYVRISILKSKKSGNPYCVLATWKKTDKPTAKETQEVKTIDLDDDEITVEDIPF
jgi:hypothetical protein